MILTHLAPESPKTTPLNGRYSAIIAIMLCCTQSLMLLYSIGLHSVSGDEYAHLPAGLYLLNHNDFSVYRENPPLPRLTSAASVLLLGHPPARLRNINLSGQPINRPERNLGIEFMYDNAAQYMDIFIIARLPCILWASIGLICIYNWSRELYGHEAALAASAIWCFEPNVLANAQLVTPDIVATAMAVSSGYTFWRWLRVPTWPRACIAGLLLGLAQLSKFSLLVLYPVLLVTWVMSRVLTGKNANTEEASPRNKPSTPKIIAIIAISIEVINIGYTHTGSYKDIRRYVFISRFCQGVARLAEDTEILGIPLANMPIPLPCDYILGLDSQISDSEEGFPAFLAGQWATRGWWYYYLIAMTLKLPFGLIILILAATISHVRHNNRNQITSTCSVIGPAIGIIALISSQTGINAHFRYVLPAIPFLIVHASTLARNGNTVRMLFACVLIAWSSVSSIFVFPHSLAYFNEIAGGPTHGHEYLIESNIDWGQDLLLLKRWIDQRPNPSEVRIACWTRCAPSVFGLSSTPPPAGSPNAAVSVDPLLADRSGPQPGVFAVSVNVLHGMPLLVHRAGQSTLVYNKDEFAYFNSLKPVDRIGHSILIYDISEEDANACRRRLGFPPIGQIN